MHPLMKKTTTEGQALIIALLIVALTATLAGGAAFRTVNQTRMTAQQEQKEKTENAARGIIEKTLNDESVNVNQDFGSTAQLDTSVDPVDIGLNSLPAYTSPLIAKDSQFMFYLRPYDFSTKAFTGSASNLTDLNLYFDSESDATCPIVEIIFAKDNAIQKRMMTGDCGTSSVSGAVNRATTAASPTTPQTITFNETTATFDRGVKLNVSALAPSAEIMIVRPLFADTKFGFKRTAGTLPAQGREVSAAAQSVDGSQTNVSVYQGYPQIPDFFFATSF